MGPDEREVFDRKAAIAVGIGVLLVIVGLLILIVQVASEN